jgi:hypothetical protein
MFFNGAAASQPRNPAFPEARLSGCDVLQWGRGFAAAESAVTVGVLLSKIFAGIRERSDRLQSRNGRRVPPQAAKPSDAGGLPRRERCPAFSRHLVARDAVPITSTQAQTVRS